MTAVERVLDRLEKVKRCDESWAASCPAHEDRNPSLSVREGVDGRVLLHCHAGCTVEAVAAALGIELADLFPECEPGGNGSRQIAATFDYVDEGGELLFQAVRFEPKAFAQRRPDGAGWAWKLGDARRVLYRLPQVLEAAKTGQTVYVVEGEKDVHALEALGLVATCNPMGAGKWRDEYSKYLRGARRVVVINDCDRPGRDHARRVASSLLGVAQEVRILELDPEREDGYDVADFLSVARTQDECQQAREFLETLVDSAEILSDEIAELVSGGRSDEAIVDADEPQDGATILEALVGLLRRFVVLTELQLVALALWIVHTHMMSASEATPYISVTSAEKRSGKTRLLEVLELVVARPWLTGRVTAAVLTRKIDKEQPCLLLDESDAAFAGEKEYAEALRAILNSGFRRSGKASICVGQGAGMTYTDLSTYSAKAIAGIGRLPDTVEDRSIPIRLKRRAPDETVERFRRRDVEREAEPVRARIAAWAKANEKELKTSTPLLPVELSDRAADVWEPLFAIAEHAGGSWPDLARLAALELSVTEHEDDSLGVRLLADIRRVFEERGGDKVFSSELAQFLAEDEESPWGDMRGRPLDARGLARILGRYAIRPRQIRMGDRTAKGYSIDAFQDAWNRYIPSPPGSERNIRNIDATMRDCDDSATETQTSMFRSENGDSPLNQADVSDVSFEEGDRRDDMLEDDGPDDYDGGWDEE